MSNPKSVATRNDKSPSRLVKFSFEEIIKWRDTARKRVEKRDKRVIVLQKRYDSIIREVNKLEKEQKSDLNWLSKLNRTLSRKAFK